MPTFVIRPMRYLLLLFLMLATTLGLQAQQPMQGGIDYPELGISFTVPAGWTANEGDGLVFFGSETVPGLILMSIHDLTTMEEAKRSLESGFSEDGIELFPIDSMEMLKDSVALLEYGGQVEGQPAKGMGLAVLNPYGDGVTIVALGLEKTFSPRLREAAMALLGSLAFREVAPSGPTVAKWQEHLTNVRLTRFQNAPSPPVDGTAQKAHAIEQRIDLCDDGFTYYSRSEAEPAASQSKGEWEVIAGAKGQPTLHLMHVTGQHSEFLLVEQEGRTYLDGQRWLRTWEGEHAPECEP